MSMFSFATLMAIPALAVLHPTTEGTSELAPWHDAASGLFTDAHLAFVEREGRDAQLGTALTLLLRQPKTDGNINEAARILGELATLAPADDIALSARFHLGRLEQAHRNPANPAAAGEHFRMLISAYPEHPYADQARVKLAIIELYARQSDAERLAHYQACREQAEKLVTEASRRDLNLILADFVLRFGYDESAALEHLLDADAAGIIRPTLRANTWVRIGELARETGRHDIARIYYRRYLDTFQRDNRRRMIEERLAAMPAPEIAQKTVVQ